MGRVRRTGTVLLSIASMLGASVPSLAQNTVSPASDWNGNYGFSSTADKNLRLLQTDVLRKNEEGYYESLGKTQITSNNIIHYGDEIGTQTNKTVNDIEQQTTAIGAVNNSTNNIDISGRGNINVATSNEATSRGCQDGHVSIDSSPASAALPTCN
ncbi:hypothetical protein GGR04_002807 [Aureimonas pseudogalii]|uniref:Uncharacterized protein n=1 Tax=Aureimonas pseudogalii TaxID=1744844 RepID=A0A7W6MKE4_9HYPH|nr:hypothetical protein [Aureimonas pseudogalii]